MKQLPQPDPRGVLAFVDLSERLQRLEDQTTYADYQRWHLQDGIVQRPFRRVYSDQDKRPLKVFTRPATPAERELLTHLGYQVNGTLDTCVHFRTATTRFRFWPTLTKEK